jgi:pimeloyl-ACP methyl ester carboxylesterase
MTLARSPFRTDAVRRSRHTLYVAHYGTPGTTPVLFVHGGPGGSIDDCARHFDLQRHGGFALRSSERRVPGR